MRFIMLLVLALAATSFAETSDSKGAQPTGPAGASGNVIKVFNDDVFNLQPKAQGPTTTKGADGKERYVAPEVEENTETRSQAMEICESQKSISMRAYQKCFAKERKRTSDNLRRRETEVESRQAQPLRNSEPLSREKSSPNPMIEMDTSDEE